jgi:hypothetical protein
MTHQIRLDEDWYISAAFRHDPRNVQRAVEQAEARGMSTICLVERVRHSTDWIRDFTEAVRISGRGSTVEVKCALEVELLDTNGLLDAPVSSGLADFIFLSGSSLPTPHGPLAPALAREAIATGKLLPAKATEWLVRALVGAVQRYDDAALVRPLGLLPVLGLDRGHLHPPVVRWLAAEMAARGSRCVLDEQLRCPDPWVVDCLLAAGVTVSASSSGYELRNMGNYEWCSALAKATALPEFGLAFAA